MSTAIQSRLARIQAALQISRPRAIRRPAPKPASTVERPTFLNLLMRALSAVHV